jgi:hypothetical protein
MCANALCLFSPNPFVVSQRSPDKSEKVELTPEGAVELLELSRGWEAFRSGDECALPAMFRNELKAGSDKERTRGSYVTI